MYPDAWAKLKFEQFFWFIELYRSTRFWPDMMAMWMWMVMVMVLVMAMMMVGMVIWEEEDESRKKQWLCASEGAHCARRKEAQRKDTSGIVQNTRL